MPFFMILSNALLFMMFLLIWKKFRCFVSFQFQYLLVKLCFLLLIVPVPLAIKGLQIGLFRLRGTQTITPIYGTHPLIVFSGKQLLLNSATQYVIYIVGIWILIICIVGLWRTIRYLSFLKSLKKSMAPVADEHLLSLLIEKQRLLNITKHVQLFQSDILCTPFTSGIQKPFIVIPLGTEYANVEFILLHELTHIRKQDVLFRMLAGICTTLYWFYPPVYYLNHFHERISELACDEAVSQILTHKEKIDYVKLILKTAKDKVSPVPYANFFNNLLIYEERIDSIMKKKSINIKRKWAATVLASLMVVLSCSPILAAPAPQMLSFIGSNDGSIDPNADIKILESVIPQPNIILYDMQITFPDGTIIPFYHSDRASKAICKHNFAAVVIEQHKRHSDGSCTVIEFTADRCSKCGDITNREVYGEYTYTKCPH